MIWIISKKNIKLVKIGKYFQNWHWELSGHSITLYHVIIWVCTYINNRLKYNICQLSNDYTRINTFLVIIIILCTVLVLKQMVIIISADISKNNQPNDEQYKMIINRNKQYRSRTL